MRAWFLIYFIFILWVANAQSQTNSDKDLSMSVGVIAGPFLPAKISGVTEILQVSGLRLGSKSPLGNFEAEAMVGNGQGVNFQSLLFNFRLNVPSEMLPVHALAGLHMDTYRKADATSSSGGGWQIGGGVESKIAGPFLLRSDFEYRFSPGQSLLVLVSIMCGF